MWSDVVLGCAYAWASDAAVARHGLVLYARLDCVYVGIWVFGWLCGMCNALRCVCTSVARIAKLAMLRPECPALHKSTDD